MRILLGLCGCLALASTAAAAEPLPVRWLYLQQNLQVTETVTRLEPLLKRAARAGYNGVVLADYKLNILDRVPEHYFKNAKRFRELCDQHGLEIIPAVAGFGYSSGILAHNPNLAEALPVRDAPFVCRGDVLQSRGFTSNLVAGDFEQHEGDTFQGWSFQDEPGNGTFADSAVVHGGRVALRIENPTGVRGNRRVSKTLRVRPWTQLHASVWIKTENFESATETRMFGMAPAGRVLSHSNLGVQKTQEWTQHHVVFNSLESSEIRFYAGVWDCGSGKLWMDDLQVVEEPFVNLVRRTGCPLVVRSESGEKTYEEGRDFAELVDLQLGVSPWKGEYDVYHTPPVLKRLAQSRIRDGERLLVDYSHAVTIYDGQMPCSLSDPEVFTILEDQVRRVKEVLNPRTYFLSHDEIRVANWSDPERASGKTAGQQLADNVRRCVEVIRKVDPQARLCIWSDMFDPHHNAVREFYLVNGDLAGSWEGLPADVLIINWNSGKAKQSLQHFGARGHGQVVAGYYDAPPERIQAWLKAGEGVPGIQGAMYTTWRNDYSNLEKFAELTWGRK